MESVQIKSYVVWRSEFLRLFRRRYPFAGTPRERMLQRLYEEYVAAQRKESE